MKKIIEGSQAIAQTINACQPGVISAYPITPQTHIVEELAKIKANSQGHYEYIRAESEFAAISIVEGALATGVRSYTATSSQGLLLMTEMIYNVAGMRLPLVMTCANRAVSAPINIWCFSKEAQVLMADLTYKAINRIKIGDLIMGKDKKGNLVFTKVKKIYQRFTDDLVEIKTNKFNLLCTPNHEFYNRSGHNHWTKAKNLKNKKLHWFGYGYKINDDFKNGWLAGMNDGDGCFYKQGNRFNFRLKVKDEEIIDYFIRWSNYFEFNIRKVDYLEYDGYFIATLTNTLEAKRFYNFLKPNNNIDFMRGYLAGLFDAEGSGPHKIKQAVIYNSNQDIIERAKKYLKKLNFNFKVYIDKRSNNYHIKINNVPEFFICCRPILQRKINNILWMTLKSIKQRLLIENVVEICKKTKVYNLETGIHNYVVNGFLVHNCDQQDAVTMRDSGWLMWFGETNQEVCDLHILAYKVAEKLQLPVMVNLDGFILTHVVEPVEIETADKIKKFLPDYQPKEFLDVNHPLTLGAFATPEHYFEIRQELHQDIVKAKETIISEVKEFKKIFGRDLSLIEYYGDPSAETVLVAMGSVLGTIKDAADELKASGRKIGVLKIVSFRPWPQTEILAALKNAKNIAVIDKSISLGTEGILASEIKGIIFDNRNITSFIVGLGGRDVTKEMIKKIYNLAQKKHQAAVFIGK